MGRRRRNIWINFRPNREFRKHLIPTRPSVDIWSHSYTPPAPPKFAIRSQRQVDNDLGRRQLNLGSSEDKRLKPKWMAVSRCFPLLWNLTVLIGYGHPHFHTHSSMWLRSCRGAIPPAETYATPNWYIYSAKTIWNPINSVNKLAIIALNCSYFMDIIK